MSYHPDTFKAPKLSKDYSLLTANQASSLIEKEPEREVVKNSTPKSAYLRTNNFEENYNDDLFNESRQNFYPPPKSSCTTLNKSTDRKFKSTLPTVREESDTGR